MIQYPDYQDGLVNLACSVLKHYALPTGHKTMSDVDGLLMKNPRHVVVLLLDGMGWASLEELLPEDSLLRQKALRPISSVFPPTTTAATTSLSSGLTPAEHGWLGWSLYFEETDDIVAIFPNTLHYGGRGPAAPIHLAKKHLPYASLIDQLRTAGRTAHSVSPFGTYPIETLEELVEGVAALTKAGTDYIYAYWPQPDSVMHHTGSASRKTRSWMKRLDVAVRNLAERLSDTLLIVTADHGHRDNRYAYITDHPDIAGTLVRPPSLEDRALAFHVQADRREAFQQAFLAAFGDEFLLCSSERALAEGLFGGGMPHPRVPGFLGDFLAIATGDLALAYDRSCHRFLSNHAGLTDREMAVPLIAVECP
ncbi:alkaline phosphatase family protein [Gehongia tenuis]|uniref:Alkaline phosphatase family protein n=1 Tax=Gehongia tenuis TaxID=2763655 RepID=A0A926D8E3_9FIRM|nr:alkaline phosphatase family protein [Gehongia tenuis]MBC8532290.1 alkaline phosphatase family protein [Gehongia tenuis]